MPGVRLDMIKQRKSDNGLAIATHGRGMYSATIPEEFNDPDLITGTDELEKPELSVYPNPVDRWLTISMPSQVGTEATIRVLDLNGKTVHTASNQQVSDARGIRYDAGGLRQGTYLLSVETGGKVYTQKIIKR